MRSEPALGDGKALVNEHTPQRECGWLSETTPAHAPLAGAEPPLRPLFRVFPGDPPLLRHVIGVPGQDKPLIGGDAGRLVIGPKLAGPRLPPPPRRGPREGGESRDFREPVRKDINKTNPRQHGEGPRPLQQNQTQSLSRPISTGERRCLSPGARRALGWRTSRLGGGGGPLA